jgi:hypothetical protein
MFYLIAQLSNTLCPLPHTRVYPKVSGLASWSENCKWYSPLPLRAAYRYLVSQSSEFCCHYPLCCFSTSVYYWKRIFRYWLSPETFGYTLVQNLGSGNRSGMAQWKCYWLGSNSGPLTEVFEGQHKWLQHTIHRCENNELTLQNTMALLDTELLSFYNFTVPHKTATKTELYYISYCYVTMTHQTKIYFAPFIF